MWAGGRKADKDGYILLWRPNHPNARKGYVREHRLKMERKLGRLLTGTEVVHHVNGDTGDNRLRNLKLYGSQKLHMRDETKGWRRSKNGRFKRINKRK